MKRISLATTLVAVAFIGVMAIATASASATVLCKKATENHYCGPENYYLAFTEIDADLASETEAKFASNSGITLAKCSQSHIDFAPYDAGGLEEMVEFGVEAWSFASCSQSITMVDEAGIESGSIEWIEGTHNGEIQLWFEFQVHLKSVGCKSTYFVEGPGELVGGLFGGPPKMIWDKAEAVRTSGNCLETMRFSATYNITSPTPFFVEKY